MPASPSIQQMPELAATMPSSPLPATAVAIFDQCSKIGVECLQCEDVPVRHQNSHHSATGQTISKNTTKLFIAQRFDACHFPVSGSSSSVGPEAEESFSFR